MTLYIPHVQDEYKAKTKLYRMKNVSRKYYFESGIQKTLQHNGFDCGVFLCSVTFCLCHDIPVDTFKDKDMKFFRHHIALSCCKGKLMNIINYPDVKDILGM